MKSERYKNQNVVGWLMSEKLNGVFARWDGKVLLSSNGNEYHAPKWFKDQLPVNIMLEGELYIDRAMLGKIVGIVRKETPIDSEWRLIKFHVFDALEIKGGFKTRLAAAAKILTGSAIALTVDIEVCRSSRHLNEFYYDLIDSGAEGIMIHCPDSEYEYHQTHKLMKYKPFKDDEAEVVGYKEGIGKYEGLREALLCRWKDVIFKLRINNEQHAMPEIGAQITFAFHGITDRGIPKNVSFVMERSYE
jgi:DNA ligase-1